MAARKKVGRKDSQPAGRAIEWGDLSASNQRGVQAQMNSLGRTLPKIGEAYRDRRANYAAEEANTDAKRANAVKDVNTMNAVLPEVKAVSMNLDTAAARHADTYRGAMAAGDGSGKAPRGAGWYYDHHAGFAKSATDHGYTTDQAVTAGAVMSPQNSPENERKAVEALMHGQSSGSIHMDSHTAAHLAKSGAPVHPDHVGTRVAFSDLHPATMGLLSTPKMRKTVDTDVNLSDVSLGGPKANIAKAVDVIRGAVKPEEAIDPTGAPKIATYRHVTNAAVPGTAEHDEYAFRVSHVAAVHAGTVSPQQSMLDVHGLAGSTQGMLSPKHPTVQDTWMNAAALGQTNEVRGRSNIMKTMGSLPDTYPFVKKGGLNVGSEVTGSGLQHAYNNEVTQRAAAQVSQGTGVALPPVAMQEVAWTHNRIEGSKDPVHNATPDGKARIQKIADTASPLESRRRAEKQGESYKMMGTDSEGAPKMKTVRQTSFFPSTPYESIQDSPALSGQSRERR